MHGKELLNWLSSYGELQAEQAIVSSLSQPTPEEQTLLQKMKDLAARAGEPLDLPEPQQEPVRRTNVYALPSSAVSLPVQAKTIANAYLRQHIDQLREAQGIGANNELLEVVPHEQVLVLLEDRSELTSSRRHGTDIIFHHRKEVVGTYHLQEPGEVGIRPRKVNLVLRVDSGKAEPLPEWFPRVFSLATVVNIRRDPQLQSNR